MRERETRPFLCLVLCFRLALLQGTNILVSDISLHTDTALFKLHLLQSTLLKKSTFIFFRFYQSER